MDLQLFSTTDVSTSMQPAIILVFNNRSCETAWLHGNVGIYIPVCDPTAQEYARLHSSHSMTSADMISSSASQRSTVNDTTL